MRDSSLSLPCVHASEHAAHVRRDHDVLHHLVAALDGRVHDGAADHARDRGVCEVVGADQPRDLPALLGGECAGEMPGRCDLAAWGMRSRGMSDAISRRRPRRSRTSAPSARCRRSRRRRRASPSATWPRYGWAYATRCSARSRRRSIIISTSARRYCCCGTAAASRSTPTARSPSARSSSTSSTGT